MFDIKPKPENITIDAEPYLKCSLFLGRDTENVFLPLKFWSLEEYRAHWYKNINGFLSREFNKTLLLTEMYDPKSANFLRGLAIYRVSENIAIQEYIIFLSDFNIEFSPDNTHKFVSKYSSVTEDGDDISEWLIITRELSEFLNKING